MATRHLRRLAVLPEQTLGRMLGGQLACKRPQAGAGSGRARVQVPATPMDMGALHHLRRSQQRL